MQSTSLARNAGLVGMAAALLWCASTVIEHSFGLFPPGHGPFFVANQLMFAVSQLGTTIGILGLLWAGAVRGRFGKIAVGLFALAYAILVVANVVALVTSNPNLFLYPIGGLLSLLAAILTGIAVAVEKRWSGWQRFMPLVHAAYVLLALYLPLFAGIGGPSLLTELGWGVSLFLLGLAVTTSEPMTVTAPAGAA